jgi:GAF domain-containing protein
MSAYAKVSSDGVLRQLLDEAMESVRAGSGAILLIDEGGRKLRFAVARPEASEKLLGLEQPLDKGITGLAVCFQQPMIVNQTEEDPTFDPTVDSKTGMSTESIMVVPLVTPYNEFGALTAVNSRKETGFSSYDLEAYSVYAERMCRRLTELDLGMQDAGSFK